MTVGTRRHFLGSLNSDEGMPEMEESHVMTLAGRVKRTKLQTNLRRFA